MKIFAVFAGNFCCLAACCPFTKEKILCCSHLLTDCFLQDWTPERKRQWNVLISISGPWIVSCVCPAVFTVKGRGWVRIGTWKLKGKSWSILCLIICKIPDQLNCIWLELTEEKILPALQAAAPEVQPIHCPMQQPCLQAAKSSKRSWHRWPAPHTQMLVSTSTSESGSSGRHHRRMDFIKSLSAPNTCIYIHVYLHKSFCRNALDNALS